jgi:2-polyprenyl-3-methyl-5-hydroxy-6-metoxy-1,4-benzoquinol methylase
MAWGGCAPNRNRIHRRAALDPLDEPLLESAPLARRLAPELCRLDPHTGERCAWNHGLWQYLRLMGLVLAPAHHAGFFRWALGAARPSDGPLRVLISGCADYGMLAQVLGALRPRGVEARVTAVDLCETPLRLNRWYAERNRLQVETCRTDILEYSPEHPFDVVCTHSFISMFERERRPALLASWHRLLRPGGLAVTVNRVRGETAGASLGFGEDEAREFGAAVRVAASSLVPEIDAEALAAEAVVYATRRRIHPVASAEELGSLFAATGFTLRDLSCERLASAPPVPVSGPTVPGTGTYLQVIAQRRSR